MQKLEGFTYKEGNIAGDDVWLVTPDDITTKWTKETQHLRSVIVRQSDGKIISSGFKKFWNFYEAPDIEPWNPDWKVQATGKKDGSLLIVSKYKDELIVRTRGTFSAKQLDNGHEIDGLIDKYPSIFNNMLLRVGYSILCEWTTPSNVIILRESDKPKLWLIGVINHDTGIYATQDDLDTLAQAWDVDRPKRHYYDSLAECMADVAMWKDQEGIVLHSEDGQVLKKVKAEHYLALHRILSGTRTMNNLIDYFFSINMDIKNAEWELISASDIYDRLKYVQSSFIEFKRVIQKIQSELDKICFADRKEFAMFVLNNYSEYSAYFLSNETKKTTIMIKLFKKYIENSKSISE